MSLINPALLYGFAFIAIPVLLHFLMRVKPKKFMFPALRLIQKRRLQNVRRMRLRHATRLFDSDVALSAEQLSTLCAADVLVSRVFSGGLT